MNRFKITFFLLTLFSLRLYAVDYNASVFGIKSNGTTLNTTAIQKAIDLIHEQGGGHLNFYVGRYLTGTIELKSDVHIVLHEGAILVGSTNIYDYNYDSPYRSLVFAKGAENISITGLGVIDGQGRELANNVVDQVHRGILKDELKLDRAAKFRPKAICLRECKNIEIEGIIIKNAAEWVQIYDSAKT